MCASWSVGSTGTRWGFCIPPPAPQQPCLAGMVNLINQPASCCSMSITFSQPCVWVCQSCACLYGSNTILYSHSRTDGSFHLKNAGCFKFEFFLCGEGNTYGGKKSLP